MSVNPTVRGEVVAFYHCVYMASEDFDATAGWTGDLSQCLPGTVSAQLHEHTLRRINYYRALAGLNADITLDAAKNAKCQSAALMMARNGALSHFPPNTWLCYTVDGNEAAGASNLSLGSSTDPGSVYYGPVSVNGQMQDAGDNNLAVGHRRWLLFSRAQEMGHGSIPHAEAPEQPGVYRSSASIWVVGDFNPAPPPGVEFIAWPPAGFVPHPVVWPRWSFGLPQSAARFASATVTMQKEGTPIPVAIIHRGDSSTGDPTLVWEPSGAAYPAYPDAVPAADTVFTVTIAGITGAPQSSYTYTVTVINPQDPGTIAITGNTQPPAHGSTTYSFTPIGGADGYEVRASATQPGNWLEGAEAGTLAFVTDQTSASYDLRIGDPKRTGSFSFHLTFPLGELSDQAFQITRPMVPSATSQLQFYNLRRWSSVTSVLRAQASADAGASWTTLWERTGNGETSSAFWDASFQPVNVSLAALANRVVMLRFVYTYLGGSYFPGTSDGDGFFLEDIQVTDSLELADAVITPLASGATTFDFTPAAAETTYFLQMRPLLGCTEFGFGDPLIVTSVSGPAGELMLEGAAVSAGFVEVHFRVTAGAFSTFSLLKSTNWQSWPVDPVANLTDHGDGSYTFRTAMPVGETRAFYRVAGQ